MAKPSTAVYDGHARPGSSIRSRSPLNPTIGPRPTTAAPHVLSTSSHDAPSQSSQWLSSTERADPFQYSGHVKPGLNDHNPNALTRSSSLAASDVEAQNSPNWLSHATSSPAAAAEYRVATRTKFLYLAGWFALNLTLTIYNKALLNGFTFPWLLTTVHALFLSAGCYLLMMLGALRLTKLSIRENAVLIAFSFLFTINIAMSNVSLAVVSIPFHQIMRSTCPVFTVVIYRLLYSRTYSTATYLSLIPIILGVALATYGDYYFTLSGFLLTLVGVVLASLKAIVSNRLMTGKLALPALEVLFRMSPLAAAQALAYALATGEYRRFVVSAAEGYISWTLALALAGNGFLAFVLNVSSFQTNKLAGALTLTVAGNMKQCLTVLLGIVLFSVKVTALNGFGMVITVFGAAWYSRVELNAKVR